MPKEFLESGNRMRYHTIYLDPPWPERGGGQIKRGADRHYKLMSYREISEYCNREILPLLEKDCHIYLWVTNNYLAHGLRLLGEMGFHYVTCITWVKDKIGLGQYYRGNTEHCLFGRRGMLPYKEHEGKRAQGTTGFFAQRTKHSRKPEEMRKMIERVSHPPFLEVFARERKEGWDAMGDELPNETQEVLRWNAENVNRKRR